MLYDDRLRHVRWRRLIRRHSLDIVLRRWRRLRPLLFLRPCHRRAKQKRRAQARSRCHPHPIRQSLLCFRHFLHSHSDAQSEQSAAQDPFWRGKATASRISIVVSSYRAFHGKSQGILSANHETRRSLCSQFLLLGNGGIAVGSPAILSRSSLPRSQSARRTARQRSHLSHDSRRKGFATRPYRRLDSAAPHSGI